MYINWINKKYLVGVRSHFFPLDNIINCKINDDSIVILLTRVIISYKSFFHASIDFRLRYSSTYPFNSLVITKNYFTRICDIVKAC